MLVKVEMLERLTALWKAGTLNDEEFQNEKRKLLSGVSLGEHHEARAIEEAPDRFGFGDTVQKVSPKRLAMFSAGAFACVFVVVAASKLVPGLIPFGKPNWSAMATPTLENEYRRAVMTGGLKFLECSRDSNEESCQKIKPIFEDAAEMADILCSRNSSSKACSERQGHRDMVKLVGTMEQFGKELLGRTEEMLSYEPQ